MCKHDCTMRVHNAHIQNFHWYIHPRSPITVRGVFSTGTFSSRRTHHHGSNPTALIRSFHFINRHQREPSPNKSCRSTFYLSILLLMRYARCSTLPLQPTRMRIATWRLKARRACLSLWELPQLLAEVLGSLWYMPYDIWQSIEKGRANTTSKGFQAFFSPFSVILPQCNDRQVRLHYTCLKMHILAYQLIS